PADPLLDPWWDSAGRAGWSARAVEQPVGAELPVAAPPLRRALPGDPHRLCSMGDRDTGRDPLAQQESATRGQHGITVGHEDLRGVVLVSAPAHLQPEVLPRVDPYRVTNVSKRNS